MTTKPALIGFREIEEKLVKLHNDGRLHHALLISGKSGIGKASFAKEFVQKILAAENENHPDLLLIEKEPEKKEITVDKIRKISGFVNQTSAISKHKFIIIDSACELNRQASNALLKILEEPHLENFLILIAHNSARILPTIRSRCQVIKIPDLGAKNFEEILRQKNSKISPQEAKFLTEICDGSIADAIEIGSDLARLYELFLRSISNQKLEEDFLKKISEKNFSFTIFEKISEFFFSRLLKFVGKFEFDFFFNEPEVFLNLTQKFSADKIFLISSGCLEIARKTTQLNLDKKLSTTNIFNKICHG